MRQCYRHHFGTLSRAHAFPLGQTARGRTTSRCRNCWALLHVVADAATSVLAIVALIAGKVWGAAWLDPVMGLVGAVPVTVWAVGLLRDTGRVLLDAQMDAPVVAEVREVIEQGPWPVRLAYLHVWQVGRGKFAVVASVVTAAELHANRIREALSIHDELVHVTVEVHRVDALPAA